MAINRKDVAAGGFFVGVALLYGGMAWRSLNIGSALNMGPGYFPLALSGLLLLLGGATVVRAVWSGPGSPFGVVPWRAGLMITLATLLFAASFWQLGMFVGVFLTAMIASLATPQAGVVKAAVVSLCISAFCVLVFSYGIGLPVPVFGSWFGY